MYIRNRLNPFDEKVINVNDYVIVNRSIVEEILEEIYTQSEYEKKAS